MNNSDNTVSSSSALTLGEKYAPSREREIINIMDAVGFCTLSQLVEYLNTLNRKLNRKRTHMIGEQELLSALNRLRPHVYLRGSSGHSQLRGNRIIYAGKYEGVPNNERNIVKYGIAKMACIIPFLPSSAAVYDVKPPMSFTFFHDGIQIEVAVIAEGKETFTCAVLDRMALPKSVNKNKLFRIAIVENEAAAGAIIGGGFESVCIVDANNKLRQIRTISKNIAWPEV